MDGWKMSFLLGWYIFRGYVKFQGSNVSGILGGGDSLTKSPPFQRTRNGWRPVEMLREAVGMNFAQ